MTDPSLMPITWAEYVNLGGVDYITAKCLIDILNTVHQCRNQQNRSFSYITVDDTIQGCYYRFSFSAEEKIVEVLQSSGGKPVHSGSNLADIYARYEEVLRSIQTLLDHKFKILQFGFSNSPGPSLLLFRYATALGREYEHRYIVDDVPSPLFSDAFLHDLKHIPSRH